MSQSSNTATLLADAAPAASAILRRHGFNMTRQPSYSFVLVTRCKR